MASTLAKISHLARIQPFRALWAARSASALGESTVGVVTAFALFEAGGSVGDLGVLLAIGTIGRVCLLPLAGTFADRYPRRIQMMGADVVRAAVQVVVGVLLLQGNASVGTLIVGYAVLCVASAFFDPASSGLVPQAVAKEDLQDANAVMTVTESIAMMSGPAVAALLVAFSSPGAAYLFDAGTYVVSAICLLHVVVRPAERPRETVRAELRQGWAEVAARPWFWQNLLAHGSWNFANAAMFVLGPEWARRTAGGVGAWGIVGAALSAGLIAGGLLVLRVRPRRPLVVGNLALLTGCLPLLALAVNAPVAVVAAAAFVGMGGTALLNGLWVSTVQALVPEQQISRVMSYDWLVSLASVPLGYALAGASFESIGDTQTLVAAAAVIVVTCAPVAFLPSVRAVRYVDGALVTTATDGVTPAASTAEA